MNNSRFLSFEDQIARLRDALAEGSAKFDQRPRHGALCPCRRCVAKYGPLPEEATTVVPPSVREALEEGKAFGAAARKARKDGAT